jgi:hypothetical protein
MRTQRLLAGHRSSPEPDSEVNDFKYALRTRRLGAAAHLIEIAADSGFFRTLDDRAPAFRPAPELKYTLITLR